MSWEQWALTRCSDSDLSSIIFDLPSAHLVLNIKRRRTGDHTEGSEKNLIRTWESTELFYHLSSLGSIQKGILAPAKNKSWTIHPSTGLDSERIWKYFLGNVRGRLSFSKVSVYIFIICFTYFLILILFHCNLLNLSQGSKY